MKPINLNRARKARARAQAKARADENAVRFGQTKAARHQGADRQEKDRTRHAAHRVEDD